jgi:hypothetical protein|nr:MAG TPA: hypothetical protein [Caudoviricetes sp.]
MIFIPEDFKSIRIKKTNIVAKRLLEGTIREIKKCPKEAREMLLSQCAPWRPDDYNIEYKEMSAGFKIFKRYLKIKGFQDVKYAEHIDRLGWTVFFYLRFEIDKYLIESCQMLTSKKNKK